MIPQASTLPPINGRYESNTQIKMMLLSFCTRPRLNIYMCSSPLLVHSSYAVFSASLQTQVFPPCDSTTCTRSLNACRRCSCSNGRAAHAEAYNT